MSMSVEMLAAENGDCLWVEYGTPPRVILIDGGTSDIELVLRAKIAKKTNGGESPLHFELMVCTHIDNDHILGLLGLLKALPANVTVGDIWFNGIPHLPTASGILAAREGEALSRLLAAPSTLPWNKAVGGKAIEVPDNGSLPTISLPDGMVLTLLSPNRAKLVELRKAWPSVIDWAATASQSTSAGVLGSTPVPRDADTLVILAKSTSRPDPSATNGSSIAFLAEFSGHSCLFTGDAHADLLVSSVKRLCHQRKVSRLKVGALKVSHHGSKGNTSSALMNLLDCNQFLISTNSKTHKHPDAEAVARLICFGGKTPSLHFNFETDYTKPWAKPIPGAKKFQTSFGVAGTLQVAIP